MAEATKTKFDKLLADAKPGSPRRIAGTMCLYELQRARDWFEANNLAPSADDLVAFLELFARDSVGVATMAKAFLDGIGLPYSNAVLLRLAACIGAAEVEVQQSIEDDQNERTVNARIDAATLLRAPDTKQRH